MAPLTTALAAMMASSPLAAAAAAVAEPSGTSCRAQGGACLAAHPPVLLQTHQTVGKPEASGVVLVPPYAAPPGAAAPARNLNALTLARARHGSAAARRQGGGTSSALSSNTASEQALKNFRLLKELRSAGFTCPGGTYFPPNNGELEFDCRLWQASVGHSLDMGQRNYFSHVTPEGLDPFDRSEPYGLPTFSENIAAGGATAASTLEQWKESDGHCTNMMDASHNRMAVGYAYVASSTYKHYWTQLFARDSGAVFRSCYTGESDPDDGGDGSGGDGSDGSGGDGSDGSGGSCVDMDATCTHWASIGYCVEGHQYQPYMHETCKLSCGLCSTSAPTSAPTGACKDSDSNCWGWAEAGYCDASSQYSAWMGENCKSSCGSCR